MLTVTELQSLLQDLKRRESELDDIEVKKAVGGTPRIFETLSSFANRPGGGLIIFGIDNDTLEPVGVGNLDELQRDIANRAAEMEPPLRVRMRSFDLEGKVVLVVEVPEVEVPEVDAQQKPCYYRPAGLHGGAYVRGGESARNPLLVRFLEDLGPMENRGSGIRAMLRSLRLAHLEPPQFDDQRTSFKVTFYNHTLLSQEVAGMRKTQRAVYELVAQHGPISAAEIALQLHLKRSTANYQIKRLLDAGLIAPTEQRRQSGRQAYVLAGRTDRRLWR